MSPNNFVGGPWSVVGPWSLDGLAGSPTDDSNVESRIAQGGCRRSWVFLGVVL